MAIVALKNWTCIWYVKTNWAFKMSSYSYVEACFLRFLVFHGRFLEKYKVLPTFSNINSIRAIKRLVVLYNWESKYRLFTLVFIFTSTVICLAIGFYFTSSLSIASTLAFFVVENVSISAAST